MRVPPRRAESRSKLWYLLLLLPFIALLFPFYLRATPMLGGFPFFYWYQFIWLFITCALTWIVYVNVRESSDG
jgi:hypothetical protein